MKWLERYGLFIALAAAWIAMLGSLYFSEVAGYLPCRLCWYQRILMYPLTAIIAVGILRRDINLPFYILPFSVVGIGVSTYHYLIQKTTLLGAGVCQEGIPATRSGSTGWFRHHSVAGADRYHDHHGHDAHLHADG
ncbi:MAG: disulfide bond formation protein B [Caldilineaceae bacterium]